MILVDSSVWIDHLHNREPPLAELLDSGEAACHPMVIGELALGRLRRRSEVLGLLTDLRQTRSATHEEVLHLVELRELAGKGLSLVDAHLLAAVMLTPGALLWTRDQRLRAVADGLGAAADLG